METSVSASTVRAGESITVDVQVTNVGFKTQFFTGSCPGPFIVLDSFGEMIGGPWDTGYCLAALSVSPTELVPGASVTLTHVWTARRLESGHPPLDPGTYRIQSEVRAASGLVRGGSIDVLVEG